MAVARRSAAVASRIVGAPIKPLRPRDDSESIRAVLIGEAPGPRGADKSGIPFFGDRAGKPLYAALAEAGLLTWIGDPATVKWDGTALKAAGIVPIVSHVMLTNAYDRCPTDDGESFRAPTRAERESNANLARLRGDMKWAMARGADRICCLGKVAATVVTLLELPITVHVLPHPSAQGLLSTVPHRGSGVKMADLEAQWSRNLVALLA